MYFSPNEYKGTKLFIAFSNQLGVGLPATLMYLMIFLKFCVTFNKRQCFLQLTMFYCLYCGMETNKLQCWLGLVFYKKKIHFSVRTSSIERYFSGLIFFFFLAELENSPRMYNLHHILLNYPFSKWGRS